MISIYPINFLDINQNSDTEVIFESINDQNNGEQWKRTGFCSRCTRSHCCDDTENIFKDVDGNGNAPGLTQVVPGKCAYFRFGDDGLPQCLGRETEYYKNGCVFWPTKIEHVQGFNDCTFIFEKIKDAN